MTNAESQSPINPISILYVDDEQDFLFIARRFLELSGNVRVDTMTSAQEAMNSPRIHLYDAIVSDYQMQGMNGITFLKAVREKYGDIPFILFTGRGREEVVIEAINNGADFYLQKGGDPQSQFAELAHKIHQAVRRKMAERSLLDSEKRLSDIIEFLPDATFAIDHSGRVIAWNQAIEEMTGILSGKMLGMGDYEYAIPFFGYRRPLLIDLINEPDEELSRHYSNIWRSGTSITTETEFTFPKGTKMSVLIKVCPLKTGDGENSGAIESIRDITELKKVEEELRDNREYLNNIFSSIKEGIAVIDARTHEILDINPAAVTMIGTEKNKIVHQICHNFICPADYGNCPISDLHQNVDNSERILLTSEGEEIPIIKNTVPFIFEGRECFLETFFDNSKRKKEQDKLLAAYEKIAASEEELQTQFDELVVVKEALEESEKKFRRLTTNARDMIYRMSLPDGKFEYISPASVALTGYTPEEYYSDPDLLKRVFHPAWQKYFKTQWEALLRNNLPPTFEYQIIDRAGKTRWFNQRNVLVTGDNGEPALLEGIVTDVTLQKTTEHELRRSEQRLLATTLNAGSWIWEVDPGGIYRYCSPAVEEILGYRPDDLVGKVHFYDLFDPPVREELKAATMEAFTIYKPFRNFVNPNRHKNGSLIILKTSGKPVFDDDGTFSGFYGVDQDITRENEAEQRLVESEARFRLLADNVQDVIWTTDEKLRLTYVTPSVMKLRGVTPKEAIEEEICDALTPESFQRLSEYQKECLESIQKGRSIPEKKVMEVEWIRRDGTQVWTEMLMNTLLDNNNKIKTIIGVTRDISERKLAEEALRESEEKFRSFVENANEVVYSLTPDGIFTYMSPKITELLGYEISEIVGKRADLFIHPDDYPYTREFFMQANVTGKNLNGNEYRVRHKDGTWQWHSQSITPICDAGGNIVSIQGISHDITEFRKSEEALRKANRQLSLLSGITRHDILNKITVILGLLGISEMDSTDPAQKEYFQMMKSNIHEIRTQIEFTRIYEELGSQEPRWVQVDTVIPRSSLPDSITLTADVQGISIFADPMLGKVFFNLLDNAVQHGQRVTEIRVYAHESEESLTLVWEDNGVGIAAEEKELIFERGFGKHTGLGMFLVREILSLTGISIRETGVPGTGSRFEIHVQKGAFQRNSSRYM
jgi:PAS domain S-box-containing protein